VSATFTPTDNTFSVTNSTVATIQILKRTTTR
jgi:hypothetical protein